jgi:hypothetical protein
MLEEGIGVEKAEISGKAYAHYQSLGGGQRIEKPPTPMKLESIEEYEARIEEWYQRVGARDEIPDFVRQSDPVRVEGRWDTLITWAFILVLAAALFGPCAETIRNEGDIHDLQEEVRVLREENQTQQAWINTICHETSDYTGRSDCP